jgi:putative transposase
MATLSCALHAQCAGLRAKDAGDFVAAAIRKAFLQPDRETAGQVWRHVADQLRPRFEKLGRLMDDAG